MGWDYDPANGSWWLNWHPGEKNPHFIATNELVTRKARIGQRLVQGMPYSREALDQDAERRAISWGYPTSDAEWAATGIPEPGLSNLQRLSHEAILFEYVDKWPHAPLYSLILPDAPPPDQISIPGHLQRTAYP